MDTKTFETYKIFRNSFKDKDFVKAFVDFQNALCDLYAESELSSKIIESKDYSEDSIKDLIEYLKLIKSEIIDPLADNSFLYLEKVTVNDVIRMDKVDEQIIDKDDVENTIRMIHSFKKIREFLIFNEQIYTQNLGTKNWKSMAEKIKEVYLSRLNNFRISISEDEFKKINEIRFNKIQTELRNRKAHLKNILEDLVKNNNIQPEIIWRELRFDEYPDANMESFLNLPEPESIEEMEKMIQKCHAFINLINKQVDQLFQTTVDFFENLMRNLNFEMYLYTDDSVYQYQNVLRELFDKYSNVDSKEFNAIYQFLIKGYFEGSHKPLYKNLLDYLHDNINDIPALTDSPFKNEFIYQINNAKQLLKVKTYATQLKKLLESRSHEEALYGAQDDYKNQLKKMVSLVESENFINKIHQSKELSRLSVDEVSNKLFNIIVNCKTVAQAESELLKIGIYEEPIHISGGFDPETNFAFNAVKFETIIRSTREHIFDDNAKEQVNSILHLLSQLNYNLENPTASDKKNIFNELELNVHVFDYLISSWPFLEYAKSYCLPDSIQYFNIDKCLKQISKLREILQSFKLAEAGVNLPDNITLSKETRIFNKDDKEIEKYLKEPTESELELQNFHKTRFIKPNEVRITKINEEFNFDIKQPFKITLSETLGSNATPISSILETSVSVQDYLIDYARNKYDDMTAAAIEQYFSIKPTTFDKKRLGLILRAFRKDGWFNSTANSLEKAYHDYMYRKVDKYNFPQKHYILLAYSQLTNLLGLIEQQQSSKIKLTKAPSKAFAEAMRELCFIHHLEFENKSAFALDPPYSAAKSQKFRDLCNTMKLNLSPLLVKIKSQSNHHVRKMSR